MMRITIALLLSLVALATRKDDQPAARTYIGFVLSGAGLLLWAATFDALGPGKDVVSDAAHYRRVILLSATGVLLSIVGLIASLSCRQRLLKISTIFVGVASTIMCAVNIIVPY
jgi:hypothetical protein